MCKITYILAFYYRRHVNKNVVVLQDTCIEVLANLVSNAAHVEPCGLCYT